MVSSLCKDFSTYNVIALFVFSMHADGMFDPVHAIYYTWLPCF
jgi:hypothetical protein